MLYKRPIWFKKQKNMKKIVLIIFTILFSTTLFAQKMTEVKEKDLPKATTDYMKANFSGAIILRAVKAEENGVITYNVAFDMKGRKHILVFDKDGNFLKKGDQMTKEQKAGATAAAGQPNAPKPPAKAPASEAAPKK